MGILLALLLLGAAFVIYKFVLLPFLRLRFYKKQGLLTQYFPLLGSVIINFQRSQTKHGDAIYDYKLLAEKEPNLRAFVRNFAATPIVMLNAPNLKKELAFQHNLYEVISLPGEIGKLASEGLFASKGEEWKKQRRIIGQAFHFELLREGMPDIISTTQNFLNEMAQKNLQGMPIFEEMETIVGENIGTMFFGKEFHNYTIKGRTITKHMMETTLNAGKAFRTPVALILGSRYIELGLFKSHRELVEDIRAIESTCQKILEDNRNKDFEKKNLAWYLLQTQKNPSEEDRLSDRKIIANYVTFISGGTMTTTEVVSMTLYELAQNPEMLQKLREEIKNIYESETPLSFDNLNKMDWLSALLKETLRLYHPSGMGASFRTASVDHKIGDINIKKGAMVGASFIHDCFNQGYFENPTVFDPKRWIEKPTISEPYAYIPFWAGPRTCIGQHFALILCKIMICEFARKFDFEMIKDYKLKLGMRKVYGPMDDLPMNLKLRS